jgi:acetyl esterase
MERVYRRKRRVETAALGCPGGDGHQPVSSGNPNLRSRVTTINPLPMNPRIAATLLALFLGLQGVATSQQKDIQPSVRAYKTVGPTEIKAHIFMAGEPVKGKSRPAIVLLHGGGWNAGSAEWTYDDAKWYAGFGMVAIAGDYRLSDQKNVTPLEAMADARDLIRWVRQNAPELGIDPHRIAVYGISAGGHLAAASAVFPHEDESKISSVPDALILLSPAVSIVDDHWPEILLGGRAKVNDISPEENISRKLPPMIIIEGAADTETPLAGVQKFCERAKQVGGTCELHVYPGVGHILSRNLDPRAQEQGPFDPDPAANADAHTKEKAFLIGLGYIN